MRLSHIFSEYFPSAIRTRGVDYFRMGAVHLLAGTSESISALVFGRNAHYGTLEYSAERKGQVTSRCSCTHFAKVGRVCPHLWAIVLAVEETDYLRAVSDRGVGILVEGRLDSAFLKTATSLRLKAESGAFDESEESLEPWQESLRGLGEGFPTWQPEVQSVKSFAAEGREVIYVLGAGDNDLYEERSLFVATRRRRKSGGYGAPKALEISERTLGRVSTADRQIFALMLGLATSSTSLRENIPERAAWAGRGHVYLRTQSLDALLPLLCQTGRFYLSTSAYSASRLQIDTTLVLSLDDAEPWRLVLQIDSAKRKKEWLVGGILQREGTRVPLADIEALLGGGWFVYRRSVMCLEWPWMSQWLQNLLNTGPVRVPHAAGDTLIRELYQLPQLPHIEWPEALRLPEQKIAPKKRLRIEEPKAGQRAELSLQVSFDYGGREVVPGAGSAGIPDMKRRVLLTRDPTSEQRALQEIVDLGCEPGEVRAGLHGNAGPVSTYYLAPKRLPKVVRTLIADGWNVEAEGRRYQAPKKFEMRVDSGVDWFDLSATVEFSGQVVRLPEILESLGGGDSHITLDDGSIGILPEEWLRRYGILNAVGTKEGDGLRLKMSQAGLLDALLAENEVATWDDAFAATRDKLSKFKKLRALSPAKSFKGKLRPYQREGLGWFRFLREFGLGGCLADDMGLGKTIQALALLDRRYAKARTSKSGTSRPSLVVVPRSVLFNWIDEAARFSPALRVLEHLGSARLRQAEALCTWDVVLTTYGTLRQDIVLLRDIEFDYVILDEAQAIKNPQSQAAKAARLLKAEYRLALSGTPIENNISELWSLFEFLNPGMLGTNRHFEALTSLPSSQAEREGEGHELALLAQALRPLILRRTKESVAADLPEKTEQTIFCELNAGQRRTYDELREHYRAQLVNKVSDEDLKRSKIQVLEALLRLRQAACHPGLIDEDRRGQSSTKLDVLLEHLEEVLSGGHKILIFSQFTKLLAILKEQLTLRGIGGDHAYLDGKTRRRADEVRRFQEDPQCKLFLISLKAGGLGLNLTAAEYVFLLDPWWNPAVEAQAIDRAHRIGQKRSVFAYRLIARDTVEEKVLELQKKKRALADALILGTNSVLKDLTRDDLDLLFS